MAFGWIGATSGFGSHVRNANAFPSAVGRQIPAKAKISDAGRNGPTPGSFTSC